MRAQTAGSSPETWGRWLVTMTTVCEGSNSTKSRYR